MLWKENREGTFRLTEYPTRQTRGVDGGSCFGKVLRVSLDLVRRRLDLVRRPLHQVRWAPVSPLNRRRRPFKSLLKLLKELRP